MKQKQERPALKIAVILGAVCVLGLFLGWFMEQMFYGPVPDEDGDTAVPSADTFAQPERQSGPSEWELTVVKRATAGLPQYPDAEAHPLAMDYMGPNVPIAAAWFTTKDSVDQVLDFYVGQFYDAGIPMTQQRPSEMGGYVAYMVPLNGNIRSVTATRQENETVVLLSNGNMQPLLEGKQEVPPNVPLPEGAENTLVLQMNQEGSSDVTVTATMAGSDVGKWSSWYEKALPEKGWKVEQVNRPSDSEVELRAVQSGQRATALLRREDDGENVSVLVRLSQSN